MVDKNLLAARFWLKVEKCGPDECWPWIGAKTTQSYGTMSVNGKAKGAHRISYFLHNDDYDIFARPDRCNGPYVLHSCDNPPCVNPAHLRLGTAFHNACDMDERGRKNHKTPRPEQIWRNAKLTPDAVREIRMIASDWDGMCDMMKKYRVGQGQIQNIAKGKIFKWFEPENLPNG